MENTEQYEGKIIEYYFGDGTQESDRAEAIVAGCDWDIGITLQLTDNPINDYRYEPNGRDMRGQEVTCIHGSSSPTPYRASSQIEYEKDFHHLLSAIKKGTYTQSTLPSYSGTFGAIACAFSA